jgi:putative oxidoreductase
MHEARVVKLIKWFIEQFERTPYWLIALLGRFSIAAIFWKSGETKVQGLALDIVSGEFQFGLPRLADSAVFLFKEEYRLPLISPESAAIMAAFAEHFFPLRMV